MFDTVFDWVPLIGGLSPVAQAACLFLAGGSAVLLGMGVYSFSDRSDPYCSKENAGTLLGALGVVSGIVMTLAGFLAVVALGISAMYTNFNTEFFRGDDQPIPAARVVLDRDEYDVETVSLHCERSAYRGKLELYGKRTSSQFYVAAWRARAGSAESAVTTGSGLVSITDLPFDEPKPTLSRPARTPRLPGYTTFLQFEFRPDGLWQSAFIEDDPDWWRFQKAPFPIPLNETLYLRSLLGTKRIFVGAEKVEDPQRCDKRITL